MRLIGVSCAVIVAAAACGGLEESRQPDAVAESGAQPGCIVVPAETLEDFLPVVGDWPRGEPTSDTDTKESVSRTQADYDKGESTLSVEIMDSCLNENVLSSLKAMLKGEGAEQTVAHTQTTTVGGFPAAEEWSGESRNGALHVLVGGRFMVKVTGAYVDGVQNIRTAAEAIDLQKLAALK